MKKHFFIHYKIAPKGFISVVIDSAVIDNVFIFTAELHELSSHLDIWVKLL